MRRPCESFGRVEGGFCKAGGRDWRASLPGGGWPYWAKAFVGVMAIIRGPLGRRGCGHAGAAVLVGWSCRVAFAEGGGGKVLLAVGR